MKYFVAYRFSGESRTVLYDRLGVVTDALKTVGIDAYCNLSEQREYDAAHATPKEILDAAFAEIDGSDGIFVLIASSDKSEGQLMEVGYAIAKQKRIIAAVHEDAATYVDELSDKVIRWQDLEDLRRKIGELQL